MAEAARGEEETRGEDAAGEDEAAGLGFLLVVAVFCAAAFLLAFLNASIDLNSLSIRLLSYKMRGDERAFELKTQYVKQMREAATH